MAAGANATASAPPADDAPLPGTSAAPGHARVIVQAHVGVLDYAVPLSLAGLLRPGIAVKVELGRRAMLGYYVGPSLAAPPEGRTLKPILGLDDSRPELPPVLLELMLFAAAHYRAAAGDLLAAALPAGARASQQRYVLTDLGRTRATQPSAIEVERIVAPPYEPDTEPTAAQKAIAKPAAWGLLPTGPKPVRPNSRAAQQLQDRAALLALALAHPSGIALPAVVRALNAGQARARRRLLQAVSDGELRPHHKEGRRPRTQASFVRLPGADGSVLGPRQARARALLDHMQASEQTPMSALRRLDAQALRLVRVLKRYGLIAEGAPMADIAAGFAGEQGDDLLACEARALASPPLLMPQQQAALDALLPALETSGFHAFLLHGATGSGKTEVYLRAIEAVLARDKTALVLVPEIALTPQLGERFRARFGDQVATFHSGLTPAERQLAWDKVASGQARIGLGARSALFLPLRNLGILVVDEEHESSFKQDEAPRYHARDLAVWRARAENACIALGSATPSLESWHNASLGRYQLLSMPDRVAARPLPSVEIVPLQSAAKVGSGLFTEVLHKALTETFARGEQAILFLNRRGFAPYVFCRDCGHSFRCQDCDVALTLHQRRGRLLCHYCGEGEDAPDACPSCQGNKVETFGLGTERIEAEVRTLFPELSLARLDRDTVRKRQDLEHVLRSFRRGKAQLLIGTQMVAKGHDFANVTLVGVVAADASLNFPDFRAAERTFQLLAQVAGRAGRGSLAGRVVVQAFEHEHYAVKAAALHDFVGFAGQELEHRRELGYPPYGYVVRLRYEGPHEGRTRDAAQAEADVLHQAIAKQAPEHAGEGVTLLGPAPAPLARLRGAYRFHTLLKAASRQALRQLLHARGAARSPADVRCIVDVDPVNML